MKGDREMEWGKTIRWHVYFFLIILFFSLFINYHYVEFGKIRKSDMLILEYYTFPYVKDTILRFGEFPGWINSHLGGMPLYANGESTVFYWNILLFLLLPISTENLLIISMIISSFLAGAFMYMLMMHLTEDRLSALVSSFVFMANGAFITWSNAWPSRSQAIIWVPLVFLYLHKAFFGKEWIKYAILTGLVLGVSFHSGGLVGFVFSLLLLPAFYLFYAIGKNPKKRLVKLSLIFLIVGAIIGGLAAVKILPMVEFSKVSSKEGGFAYEQFIGQHIQISSLGDLSKIIKVAVGEQLNAEGIAPAKIGWIALALVLLSFFRWRKRTVLFFILFMVFIILIATGSYLNYPLWKLIPGFSKLHHVQRSLFLLTFAWAVLAGFGVGVVREGLLKAKFKQKTVTLIVGLVLGLIMVEIGLPKLAFVDENKIIDFQKQTKDNQLMQYLSSQEGIFRIHNINTRMIGGVTTTYASHLGLEILYTTSAIWIPEYFNEYLGIASQAPAKFWGMLNTKYVYSDKEINVSGLSFVRKFEECEMCFEDKASETGIDGPYLYINEKYLPRAYIAKNGLLVLGNEQTTENLMYGLMLLDSFNPADTVIIPKGEIEDYTFLKKFKAIFLTAGSVDDTIVPLLQRYVQEGGRLFPDIFAGELEVSAGEIEGFLKGFDKKYYDVNEAEILKYSPNQRIIRTEDKEGFLVLAEKFYLFEGWKAYGDKGRLPLLRANGVNSVIALDGASTIDVKYRPKSFRIGAGISGLTLAAVLLLLWKIRKK